MARLVAPLAHFTGRGQEAIHRPRRAEIGLFFEQRGVDFGRGLVDEPIAVQHVEDGLAFVGAQRPRRGWPRRP